jgi:hypothetical protein
VQGSDFRAHCSHLPGIAEIERVPAGAGRLGFERRGGLGIAR